MPESFAFKINSQTERETSRDIPALADFHEVIYPIWHEAFPEKNIKSLKEFSATVKSSAEKIYLVELPGIMKDKENKWQVWITKFKTSVDEFHKDLYMIFHHYMPNKELNKLNALAEGLKSKSQLLASVKIPIRLEEKQTRYNSSVEELITNTNLFVESLKQDNYEVITESLDKMHTSYQKLEAIFD